MLEEFTTLAIDRMLGVSERPVTGRSSRSLNVSRQLIRLKQPMICKNGNAMKYLKIVLAALIVEFVQHFVVDGHMLNTYQVAAYLGRTTSVLMVALFIAKYYKESTAYLSILVLAVLMYLGRG
jgi:hypothetical protein